MIASYTVLFVEQHPLHLMSMCPSCPLTSLNSLFDENYEQNYIWESFLVFIELCGNSPAYFTDLNKQRGIHILN